jgi:hypothetical protein
MSHFARQISSYPGLCTSYLDYSFANVCSPTQKPYPLFCCLGGRRTAGDPQTLTSSSDCVAEACEHSPSTPVESLKGQNDSMETVISIGHYLLHAFGVHLKFLPQGSALRREQARSLVREQLILPDLASEGGSKLLVSED